MRVLDVYRLIGPVDLKNVRRDDLLSWAIGIPFLIALLFRYGVPPLAAWLSAEFGFDLVPYYPLVMSTFIVMAPSMVGMVIGFLLLDERDDQVLTALMVTPMPYWGYLLYRITMPLAFGLVITMVGYVVAGLAPLPFRALLPISLLGAVTGPACALFLAVTADNKVSGFAIIKILNTINMLPIAAYFIGMPWELVAGVVPAYWPMKMVWQAADGAPFGIFLAVGLVVNVVAVYVLLRLLNVRIRR